MTNKYGGCTRREVREMMQRGNAAMAGIREERAYRRRIGAEEMSRWMRTPDMDRWDRDVNWCMVAVCVLFAAAMVLMCWPAMVG